MVVSPGSAQGRTGYRVIILDSSGSAENRIYGPVAVGEQERKLGIDYSDMRGADGELFLVFDFH